MLEHTYKKYLSPISFLMALFICQISQASYPQVPLRSPIESKVIYGEDDRLDIYQVMNSKYRVLSESTVALIDSSNLISHGSSTAIKTRNFQDSYRLCDDEPFKDQNIAPFCSGFLVSNELIVTAGHCVTNQTDCDRTKFVFGYAIYDKGVSPSSVPTSEVYGCKELVATEMSARGADFAVIRLDRKVINHPPLSIRRWGSVEKKTPLVVAGHPAGLPLKVSAGAKVRSLKDEFFVTNLDSYGGNSGSAVFNAQTGVVEGILVRGETDFVIRGECRVSNYCSEKGCRGEDVTKITELKMHIPMLLDDLFPF